MKDQRLFETETRRAGSAGDDPAADLIQGEVIRRILEEMAEPDFQKFASSLIPNIPRESLLGVRLPRLRRLAAKIAKGDWRMYLAQARDDSYEEIMLQGMVIGKIQASEIGRASCRERVGLMV